MGPLRNRWGQRANPIAHFRTFRSSGTLRESVGAFRVILIIREGRDEKKSRMSRGI
jgi:hypothetical protein